MVRDENIQAILRLEKVGFEFVEQKNGSVSIVRSLAIATTEVPPTPYGYIDLAHIYLASPKVYRIGRDPDREIYFSAQDVEWRLVGRQHAEIAHDGDLYYLTDGSTNGTFINGRHIPKGKPFYLSHDDKIGLGNSNTIFVFEYKIDYEKSESKNVLLGVAIGLKDKQIASFLRLSFDMVRIQLEKHWGKLGLDGRMARVTLIQEAKKLGKITDAEIEEFRRRYNKSTD